MALKLDVLFIQASICSHWCTWGFLPKRRIKEWKFRYFCGQVQFFFSSGQMYLKALAKIWTLLAKFSCLGKILEHQARDKPRWKTQDRPLRSNLPFFLHNSVLACLWPIWVNLVHFPAILCCFRQISSSLDESGYFGAILGQLWSSLGILVQHLRSKL